MPAFSYSTTPAADAVADLLVLPVFRGPKAAEAGPGVAELGILDDYRSARLRGGIGDDLLIPSRGDARFRAAAVLLVGMGKRDGVSPGDLRRAMGRASSTARNFGKVATTLPQVLGDRAPDAIQAAVEGLVLGAYRFDRYRGSPSDGPPALRKATVLGDPAWSAKAARRAVVAGEVISDAVIWARDLVNTPPIDLTPDGLAQEASAMAKAAGLRVKVWNESDLERGRFGGILGVGAGSVLPPRLIELVYPGAGDRTPLALTGKGITFDAGGLDLKKPKEMEEEKVDMGGAASVLAAMKAAARLEAATPVIAAIPSAENMPGATAIRPGDVLRHRGGTTSEVIDTDSEGRLVLADALAYLAESEPAAIVDVATLTGSVAHALGEEISGVLGNDPDLVGGLIASGGAVDEPLWELPLWRRYRGQLDSTVADLRNEATRIWAGAITPALFLEEFVGGIPWAHIDIGGTAFADEPSDYCGPGGTGVPTRALVHFLLAGDGSSD
jgi:leucyl aminopeptidase